MNDNINHPAHYTDGKIEVIDFIEDKKLPYHLGNVIKYISRAGKKSPDTELEDLKKAQWYLNRYIELKEQINEQSILPPPEEAKAEPKTNLRPPPRRKVRYTESVVLQGRHM